MKRGDLLQRFLAVGCCLDLEMPAADELLQANTSGRVVLDQKNPLAGRRFRLLSGQWSLLKTKSSRFFQTQ